MHTLAQMLSAVLVTAFFFFQTAIAHADGLFSATVTQCTDGDTLVLDTGQRVRLAGVDTPEKGSKDTPPQYYAREAARFTCERTRKQRVKVIPLPEAQEPYIGNRNSKRFFSKACLRTANISKKNQIRFSDLEEAFRSGYAPARPCGIWPSAE